MTITNGLITADEFARFTGYPYPADYDKRLETDMCITVASRMVEMYCGREFHTTASSARYYDSKDGRTVVIDDATSVSAVAIDNGMDGSYSTAFTSYQLLPTYSATIGAVPYRIVRATGWSYPFPIYPTRLGSVRVTAVWGWSAVPDPVKHATAVLAQDLLRDSQAGFGGLQVTEVGLVNSRIPQRVRDLLAMYRRAENVMGFA